MLSPDFEEFYKKTPVDEIPWYKIVPTYLKELVGSGKIKPCKALSVGCGLGTIEIYLASKGFEVTAVDISKTAIRLAKEKAQSKKVEISFYVSDASNLEVLGDNKFDLVLEWALIHCMPKESHEEYVKGISRVTNESALLVQRSFSKRDPRSKDGVSKSHLAGINYHFDREDIKKLYRDWEILEYVEDQMAGKYFDQYLMRKK